MSATVDKADCLEWLAAMPEQSCDLVCGSPPYLAARLYLEGGENLGIARNTEEWVAWMVQVVKASLRVCRGLVVFVVEGSTKDFRYQPGPVLLMADLHRAGVHLRKPPIYYRIGIPGSGGPDWWRNDYEFCVCATNGGKLPWSDNTAMGHKPKWAPGGEMSHRLSSGTRVNQWGKNGGPRGMGNRNADGSVDTKVRPSHKLAKGRRVTSGHKDGDTPNDDTYSPPVLANPGNLAQEKYSAEQVAKMLQEEADVIRCKVGGGLMGHDLAHENEAPLPLSLVERFVLSFCPPGGKVIDPFCGSGTTGHAAVLHGREFAGCDLRESQVQLARKRIASVTPDLFGATT
jgi:hypothetical protein